MRRWLDRVQRWASAVKRDVIALWYAARDPRVPWYAKGVAACVVAYALSPIDLVPDFIPVIGYLDDLILLPLGIVLAVKLVPPALMQAFRELAAQRANRPVSHAGAIAIALTWAVASGLVGAWLWKHFHP